MRDLIESLKFTGAMTAVWIFLMLVLPPLDAEAQSTNCAPRDQVVKRLAEKYGESRKSIGISQRGAVMETFASDETGSWTITITTPNGTTCLIDAGRGFQSFNEALPPEDEDA